MTIKNDTKFEQEFTVQFEIDLRNLTTFDSSTQILNNLHFNGQYTKFEGKLTCISKNDTKNLANFQQSTFKSLKIWSFVESFYLK